RHRRGSYPRSVRASCLDHSAPTPTTSSRVLRAPFADVAVLAAEELALAVDLGEQRDRTCPQLGRVAQRIACLRAIEVDALVDMAEQELAAVLEVAVLDDDDRLAAVREHAK